jgi:hypothetical protein
MTEGISLNLSCPSCGGSVTTIEGERAVVCSFCQSLLYVEGDRGVFTVMFRNNMDKPRVIASLKEWFKKGYKARDLPDKAQITEVYPIYLPFWRLVGRAAGWVCGYKEERRTDRHGNTQTKRVPLEKMVFRDLDWSEIACDPGDLGIEHLPSTSGQVISHEEGDIPTFEATTSADDARADGIESIRHHAVKSANVPHISFQKMHVLPKYLSLNFYPIWMARYTYLGRTYFATLDGVVGGSLSGRAPGDPLYQSLALVGGAAAGGIILGLSGAAMTSGLDVKISAVGAIIGIAIFIAAFYFFRHGSEITEGDIERPYKTSLKDLSSLEDLVEGFD